MKDVNPLRQNTCHLKHTSPDSAAEYMKVYSEETALEGTADSYV